MDAAEVHLTRLVEADDPVAVAAEVLPALGEEAALDLVVTWGRAGESAVRCASLDLLYAVTDAAWEASEDGPDSGLVRVVVEQAGSVSPADEDEYLRWRAARTLGSILDQSGEALGLLLRFADDEDDDVRYRVSFSVAFSLSQEAAPDDADVQTLSRLIGDSDPDVRDMASFAFTMSPVDSPAIRDGLVRLSSTDQEPAAAQAGEALAQRRDARVIPVALDKLAHDDVSDAWVWTVAHTWPARAFLPALLRLRDTGWPDRPNRPDGHGLTFGRELQRKILDDAITAARTA